MYVQCRSFDLINKKYKENKIFLDQRNEIWEKQSNTIDIRMIH